MKRKICLAPEMKKNPEFVVDKMETGLIDN
jgi:hypothetical protein